MSVGLIPLKWTNLLPAFRVAKRIFKRDAMVVFQSYAVSLLPRVLLPREARRSLNRMSYFLAFKDNRRIGVTGFYVTKDAPREAWLGWFGIDNEMRSRGLGKDLLMATIDLARKEGFNNLRLWSTDNPNLTVVARKLFRMTGMNEEKTSYTYWGYPVLIYSISLKVGGPAPYLGSMKNAFFGCIEHFQPRPE